MECVSCRKEIAEPNSNRLSRLSFGRTLRGEHLVLLRAYDAHPGFIGIMFSRFPADKVLIGARHADTQLVENLESCLLARKPKLPLELNCGYAWCLTGDQISRPEPHRERRVRARHDGSGCETSVVAALSATKHPWAGGASIRLTRRPTMEAGESAIPPCALKVCRARCLVRKQALELRQRARPGRWLQWPPMTRPAVAPGS
jgi:hypothetical protein